MPIKIENKSKYPKNWKDIRKTILVRANYSCEGSPRYPDCKARQGALHPVTSSIVILTVAHLDHKPENCSSQNMRAMCQRCHLDYDQKMHIRNAKMTIRQRTVDKKQ